MVQIRFVSANGAASDLEVAEGETLMRAAIAAGLTGIDAMCGGAASCATCQIYIEDSWFDRLDPPEELESMMLELAEHKRPTSRLSCQITAAKCLDGLVVHIPESQV